MQRSRPAGFLIPLLSACLSFAQSAPATPRHAAKTFDVVSIHPSDPALTTEDLGWNHGELSARGVTLSFLIQVAYDIRDFQVVGIPRGLDSAKYDISTRTEGAEAEPTPVDAASAKDQVQAYQTRLQAMLADRFHLKLQVVTKDMPIYALVVAKAGPKLRKAEQTGDYLHVHVLPNGSEMEARNIAMPDFADEISVELQRKVIDETGLKGGYDFELKWTPDNVQAPDASAPSLFTAVQEQLGLKLDHRTGPMQVYLIDHIEAPTAN
jgi:uncharacterized protein (TIGR03435 family)